MALRYLIGAPTALGAVFGLGYTTTHSAPSYPVPIAAAYEKLRHTPMSEKLDAVEMRASGISETIDGNDNGGAADGGKSIRWSLSAQGMDFGTIDATLTPTWRGGTQVSVAFHPTQAGAMRGIAHFVADDGLIQAALQQLLDERVGSVLEDRPFDKAKVAAAVRWYAMTHPWQVAVLQEKFSSFRDDPAAAEAVFGPLAEHQRSAMPLTPGRASLNPELDAMRERYRAEQAMRDAARPQTDLSGYR